MNCNSKKYFSIVLMKCIFYDSTLTPTVFRLFVRGSEISYIIIILLIRTQYYSIFIECIKISEASSDKQDVSHTDN